MGRKKSTKKDAKTAEIAPKASSPSPIDLPSVKLEGELSREDFELRNTLGTGTFGRVMLVRHIKSGNFYALKILGKENIIKLKQVDHLKNERSIMEALEHAFMVNMVGFFQDERNLYMVLEYVPGGELFTLLRRETRFKNDIAVFFAAQLVLAFEYMHSQDIIYRDLKPENILLGGDGYVKVCDFGFAKLCTDRAWTLCGTPEYIAPEIITQKGHNHAVDWWALGVLIYEMIAGYPPFYDETHFGIYQQILSGKVTFSKSFNKESRDLIRKLLQSDRTRRYGSLKNGVNDIKAHPWFRLVDWDALERKEFKPPFVPKVKSASDTSNFDKYPESDGMSAAAMDRASDPFYKEEFLQSVF